jgi:hypothetical protein
MVIHKADLNEWLFILLTRLLCKLGGDLLASIHSKVVRVLDVVRLVAASERDRVLCMNKFVTFGNGKRFINSSKYFLKTLECKCYRMSVSRSLAPYPAAGYGTSPPSE